MNSKVKVSIVMGIYNCDKYLTSSIDSILDQSFKDWELIMCDDGSTDDTYNIAKIYSDKYPHKIKLIANNTNMGLNHTLNRCISISRGEYIARQDGDDVSIRNRLEKQLEFIEKNPEFSLVGSDMSFFDESGVWGSTNVNEKPNNYNFIKSTPFCHATCIIRKSVLLDVGCYTVNDKLLRVEDYHLWFKVYAKGYRGYNIKEILYLMRDDRSALSRRTFKSRLNESRVKCIGFKMLDIPLTKYIYVVKPLVVGILPKTLYNHFRKKRLS